MLISGEDLPIEGGFFVSIDEDGDKDIDRLMAQLYGVLSSADPEAYMNECYPAAPKDITLSKDRRDLKKDITIALSAGMFATVLAVGFIQYNDYISNIIKNAQP